MHINEFCSLNQARQLALINADGVYISKRKEANLFVVLYQFTGLYIEIFYHKYRLHVARIEVTDSTEILEPYLDLIDVSEFVEK